MEDFLGGNGVFTGTPSPPEIPAKDLDLGERATGFGNNSVGELYWGKSNGVIFPISSLDKVAIGALGTLYDEKLYVAGKILSQGYNLSDTVYITKDGSNNLVFTDPISGSKTLAQLIGAGSGNVISVGTPTNLQLAQWTDSSHIQGIAISSLTLTQTQITGLTAALASKAALVHNLIDPTNHTVSGLTSGYFLKALTATTYGFVAHGLTKNDIGLSNVTNDAQVKKISSATNNALVRWDGATGDQIKNSVVIVGDDGSIDIPSGATFNINGVNHTHAGQYQAVDNTLTALAGLDTSIGFIYQTGADLFTKYGFAGSGAANTVARSDHNHTGTYLTGNQTITLLGDVTGSAVQNITATLATVNANVFGSNTLLKFTVNGKGLVTAAVVVAESDLQSIFGSKTANYIYASPSGSAGNPTFRALVALDIPTIAQSQVTNLVADLAGKQASDAKLTTYSALTTSTGYLYNNGSGTLSWTTPGGGGNVSNSGSPTNGQLAQWINSTTIQGIAINSISTEAFGALTDVTTNNATTSQHGFLMKLGGGTTNFLRADGTWAAPSAAAPANGIWFWDSGNTKYAPYASKQATLQHFYLGTTNPDQTTRLNIDAYVYATQLFDSGTRVLTANQSITLSSDVTGTGTTAITTTIAAAAVTYAKFQNMTGLSVHGNPNTASGVSSAITGTASQILQVNAGGTALAFISIANAFGSQTANTFWAAPNGSAGNPTFRVLVKADISGTTAVFTDQANTFGDFNNIFRSSRLAISNPANTFNYTFVGAAIAAARSITMPLLTGDDVLVTADFTQTLTNKTLNATNNTITDTSIAAGDLFRGNGTKFVRFAKGSALQVLRVNAGATDIEWAAAPTSPVDNILDWDGANNWYAPWSNANKAAGRLYSFTSSAPSNNTVLAYDGYLYSTRVYAVDSLWTSDGTGTTYFKADVNSMQINITGTTRVNFGPTISDGASAVAYYIDTHNQFVTAGAKLFSIKNQGTEKFYVDKDGEAYANGVHLGAGGISSYPGAGIPNSTGSAWGTSYSTTGSGTVVALAASPTFTGTTNIGTNLIITGTTQDADFTVLKLNHRANTVRTGTVVELGYNNAACHVKLIGYNNPNSTLISQFAIQTSDTGGVFHTGLYQDENANIGIGTTSNITAPLTVQANVGGNAIKLIGRNNGTIDEATITFYDNDGTTARGNIQKYGSHICLMPDSNVGIGIVPSEKLHLDGRLRIDNQAVAAGSGTATGLSAGQTSSPISSYQAAKFLPINVDGAVYYIPLFQ